MPQAEHLEQQCAARTQAQVRTQLATEPAQRQHEGLGAWSCVAEFTMVNYKSINSATKHAMSTGPVLRTCLRCALIFLFYFLYQDKKWRKKRKNTPQREYLQQSLQSCSENTFYPSFQMPQSRTFGTAVLRQMWSKKIESPQSAIENAEQCLHRPNGAIATVLEERTAADPKKIKKPSLFTAITMDGTLHTIIKNLEMPARHCALQDSWPLPCRERPLLHRHATILLPLGCARVHRAENSCGH